MICFMKMNRKIFLIGPKHSGKTSAGKKLASIININFYDLDEVMETETGKSPRELYKEGIEKFKVAELNALSGLLKKNENYAAAAGGGLIDNQQAMALLKNASDVILIYLEVSAGTAWKRIIDTAAGGELPAFLNKTDPKKSHFAIHERRANLYREAAHLTIVAEGKNPEELSAEIVSVIAVNVIT